jgi:hypothetical protein
LVVGVEEGQRVVVGRAVELAAVHVVAAAVEGSLDYGEGLLIGELAGTPCQACWVSWIALRWVRGMVQGRTHQAEADVADLFALDRVAHGVDSLGSSELLSSVYCAQIGGSREELGFPNRLHSR